MLRTMPGLHKAILPSTGAFTEMIGSAQDLMGYKLDEAVQRADGLRSNGTV